MAESDTRIFSNLPGSPPRPKPPPNRGVKELFPVSPLEVAGGLQHLYAEGVGRAAAYMAGHPAPLPGVSYWVQPDSVLASADQFGRDISQIVEKPGEHISPGSAARGAGHVASAQHYAPVVATGWAPAAWQRINKIGKTEPEVAGKIASLTPTEANDYFFDKNAHNTLLSDVITQHMHDQYLVDRTATMPSWLSLGPPPDPRAFRAQLDDLRGRPVAPYGVPPGQVNLGSGGPRTQYTAQEPSVLNTFGLQQPNMPPFPANDPRAVAPPTTPAPWPPPGARRPGMTLNSPPQEFF